MTKDAFFRAYANLPEDVRKEIIVVVNQKPYTWDVVAIELSNDTELGKEMLLKLVELGLI